MKILFTILPFVLLFQISFAQHNPPKPNLRQGKFFTEDSAAQVLKSIAQKYSDKASWEKRASLLRQGILDGAEIEDLIKRKPFEAQIHSLKTFEDYTVSNVYIEGIDGIYITGNLYQPLNQKGKSAGILCPHGHGTNPRLAEYTQQRCATLVRMGAVVFAYDF